MQTAAPAAPITDTRTAKKMVEEIARLVSFGEDYAATRLERELWEGVLEAIAGANAQAGYIAAAALESKKIDFQRTALI